MEEMIREIVEEVMGDEIRDMLDELLRKVVKEEVENWYCSRNLRDYIEEHLSMDLENADDDIECAIGEIIGDILSEY